MRNNFVKLFEFGLAVQEEMSFKAISYLALWQPLLQWSGTICAILEEGIMQEEQFCEIILNLGQWFRKRCHLKKSYLELLWPLYSLERNAFCTLSRRHYAKPSCKVILIWTSGSGRDVV